MHMYVQIRICIQTHTHMYTQIHKITPVLSGWDHTWERETYPLIPCFTDHYRGSLGGFFFFFFPMKHVTGEKKNLQTIQAFGDLGCLKDEQLKG